MKHTHALGLASLIASALTVCATAIGASPGFADLSVSWEVMGPRRIANPPFRADKPLQSQLDGSGKVAAFALHPTRAEVMYAGAGVALGPPSSGGLYSSNDGGTTWRPSIRGITDVAVSSLWIDRNTPTSLLASTLEGGIFRSTDGGTNWVRVAAATLAQSIVESGSDLYACTRAGILRSQDRGATWRQDFPAPATNAYPTFMSAGPGAVWAILYNGAVLKRLDTDQIWRQVSAPSGPSGSGQGLAVNPRDGKHALALVWNGDEVICQQTQDGGTTWQPLAQKGFHAVAFDSVQSDLIYGGTNSRFLTSRDQGATWTERNLSQDMRSIYSFENRPGWVVAGGDHGLYLSTDYGVSWRVLHGDLSTSLVGGFAVSGRTILAVPWDYNGVFSFDGGTTWQNNSFAEGGKIFIHPADPLQAYFFNRAGTGLSRSTNGGRSWSRPTTSPTGASDLQLATGTLITLQLAPSDKSIAFDPRDPAVVYVCAHNDGVYRSTDRGASFTRLPWPFPQAGMMYLDRAGTIYVGVRRDDVQGGTSALKVSKDGGSNWFDADFTFADEVFPLSLSGDPNVPGRVTMVTSNRDSDAVWTTTDSGKTFRPDYAGIPQRVTARGPLYGRAWVYSVEYAPAKYPGMVALASAGGVFARVDEGPWVNISGNAVTQVFSQVNWDSDYLYVSTWGQGVIRVPATSLLTLIRDLPRITTPLPSREIGAGGEVTLSASATGAAPLAYQWQKDGVPVSGATNASLSFARLKPSDAGSYSVTVANAAGTTTSTAAQLSVPFSRLTNLSVLAPLTAPGDTFTVGYVIGGSGTIGGKNIVARAVGPSLTPLGVAGALADPKLERFAGAAKTGENDNWGGSTSLSAAMSAVGAFALSGATSRDAAVSLGLPSGDHSLRISGVGNATGLVLAEVYDASPAVSFSGTTPRLLNLSVLKESAGGLTAGFVIAGTGEKRILVRVVGPTLGSAFGVAGAASDPRLTLFAGTRELANNDNWGGSAALVAAFAEAGAFGLPAASSDAALVTNLGPGNYSVRVDTPAGTSGIVLLEIYELPW